MVLDIVARASYSLHNILGSIETGAKFDRELLDFTAPALREDPVVATY